MSNDEKKDNIFCNHNLSLKSGNSHDKDKLYDYCEKCGSISINNNNHVYYSIKPKMKQKEIEFDPVQIVKEMIKYQNKNYPYLNNVFNLNLDENSLKLQEIKERIFLYLSKRKLLLLYLQSLTKLLNYSDLSFYHCLLLTDLYLSHNITQKMTDEELLYILIGFFLISSKFKETDIFEPELYIFCNIDFDFALTVEKILYYETKCLKFIKYNFFIYSTYDWINIFMGNGYIFDGEIEENNNEEINDIYSYCFKVLITITPKNIFIKYSPMYNAVSVIKISREDKIDKNKINNELFNKYLLIYGIQYKDYQECYIEIKSIIDKYNSEKNIQNSSNKIRTLKRENDKTLNELDYNEKENENKNVLSSGRTGKKYIKFDFQRKLNLKQKLGDNKFQINLFSLNTKHQMKKKFGSINITSNNSNIKTNKIFKKQNTLQIVEYINENLPKIKKLDKTEGDKVYQTETEVATGRNKRMLTIKNNLKNNYFLMKNKKKRNKSGASLDVKLFYDNGKSPLGFNRLLRTITYDALKNNEVKINKKLTQNNTNLAANQKNAKILNKSSDALKYSSNNNDVSNPKINNIFEFNNKIDIIKKNNNSNINIYNTNINEEIKRFNKQNTADYLESNNIKIIKPEKEIIKVKNIGNVNNKEVKYKKLSSIEKNNDKIIKDKTINNNIIKTKNKFILFNNKKQKNNLKNVNELLALKKMIFKNKKLPFLKLKLDK